MFTIRVTGITKGNNVVVKDMEGMVSDGLDVLEPLSGLGGYELGALIAAVK